MDDVIYNGALNSHKGIMRHSLRRILIGMSVFIAVYLSTVAIWAASSIESILARHPVAHAPSLLTPRQSALLLQIEDPTFRSHHGLSLANGQGATTLTSSLARDVFLFRTELTGVRGTLQALYRRVFACCKKIDLGRDVTALVLDAHMSKDEQLALFVDQVYMGRHQGMQLRGLAQASAALMGKPLAQLTQAEFSGLVGMIRAPNELHPVRNAAAHLQRRARVQAIGSGACEPQGWFDTDYAACSAPPG
ncbi:transglycosylase domain-containing protein [Massilia sp. PAMC28688]|uniref:transglycosylase domain-containing protein n=1 Tax=Massilia sp. PAMC28688 TaxID=2861283 RepID=UPI001C63073A|nr:transglycosylase domain-containing protein [Massilia sp. PAMC28688]QYF92690.1 transglycosylase domain-containing protein [Massilia sp. PAMC28688]